jgi:hypothetical protein
VPQIQNFAFSRNCAVPFTPERGCECALSIDYANRLPKTERVT